MLFLGWQGIYTVIGVSVGVLLLIVYFAKRLDHEMPESEANLATH